MEETSYNDLGCVLLLKYPVSNSWMETLSLALVGYTCQRRRLLRYYLNGDIAWSLLDLIFKVKTHDLTFDGWIRR